MEMPDTRIPLTAEAPKLPTPFEMKGQQLALEKGIREQRAGQEQDQDQQALKQYLAEGGNISTPEGLQKAEEDLKGQVSPDMTMQLAKARENFEQMSLNRKSQIAKLDDAKISQIQEQYKFMDEAATDTYDIYTKTAKTQGSQAAKEAFEKSKQEYITRAQSMGFPPEQIKRYQDMTPAEMASLKTTVTHQKKELEDAVTMRLKAAQSSRLEALAKGTVSPTGQKAPAGYRYNEEGNLEFIPGGPADPETRQRKLGSREQVFLSRTVTSANEAMRDLENVVRMPASADTGIFGGMAGGHPTSLYESGRNVLLNKITPQEVQSYKVLASGFQRSLAGIESSGLAPSGQLTGQMEAVLFAPGDTNFTKLQKLAQTRQIVEAGMETALSNPSLPDKERKHIEDVLKRLEKAVPYTQGDLLDLQAAQQKNPEITLRQIMERRRKAEPEEKPATEKPPATKPSGAAPKKKDYGHLWG